MEFTVKILSPLHIGCGESYSGLNYIIDGGRLYYVEPDAVYNCLDSEAENGLKRLYVKWLEDESNRIAELEKLEREVEQSRKDDIRKQKRSTSNQFNLKNFCQQSRTPVDQMKQAATYNLPCKGKVFDSSDIQKFISQLRQPYLPGTEIKGAIRTAILLDLLKRDTRPYSWLKTEIERFGDRHQQDIAGVRNQSKPNKRNKENLTKRMANITKELEERAFCSPLGKDAKYDFLKYLSISDSHRRKPEDVLCVAYAEPFNTRKPFRVSSEYCQPWVEFHFKDMTLEDTPLKREKLSFSQHQKEMISDITNVLHCCHDFTQDLLEEEIDYFRNLKQNDIVKHLQHIKDQNEPSAPVLRIGKDEGYLSVTMGLLIKHRDPALYENVLIHATKGKSYDSTCGGPLPKSRKIVHCDGQRLTSGWVKLIPAGTPQRVKTQQTTAHPPEQSTKKAGASSPSSDSLEALLGKWKK